MPTTLLLPTQQPVVEPKTGLVTREWLKQVFYQTEAVRVARPFASLPSVPQEGMLMAITDSTTAVWGAAIAGGGANHVLGFFNGAAWTVVAK